jgi:hypothetical protein
MAVAAGVDTAIEVADVADGAVIEADTATGAIKKFCN